MKIELENGLDLEQVLSKDRKGRLMQVKCDMSVKRMMKFVVRSPATPNTKKKTSEL